MGAEVKLDVIIEALELADDSMSSYLDVEKGEVCSITEEEYDLAADPQTVLEDLPDWQREAVELARSIQEQEGRRASACRRAKLERIDWHTLRHTYSTLLHDVGTPLKVQQSLLGHSSLATTMDIYTHVVSDSQRQAVAKLDGLLFPSVPKLHSNAATEKQPVAVTQ